MRIVKTPGHEYYLIKGRTNMTETAFGFKVRKATNKLGVISIGSNSVLVPKEFIGKKIFLKVEVDK